MTVQGRLYNTNRPDNPEKPFAQQPKVCETGFWRMLFCWVDCKILYFKELCILFWWACQGRNPAACAARLLSEPHSGRQNKTICSYCGRNVCWREWFDFVCAALYNGMHVRWGWFARRSGESEKNPSNLIRRSVRCGDGSTCVGKRGVSIERIFEKSLPSNEAIFLFLQES